MFRADIRLVKAALAMAQRFDLGAGQGDAGDDSFFQMIVKARAAVIGHRDVG